MRIKSWSFKKDKMKRWNRRKNKRREAIEIFMIIKVKRLVIFIVKLLVVNIFRLYVSAGLKTHILYNHLIVNLLLNPIKQKWRRSPKPISPVSQSNQVSNWFLVLNIQRHIRYFCILIQQINNWLMKSVVSFPKSPLLTFSNSIFFLLFLYFHEVFEVVAICIVKKSEFWLFKLIQKIAFGKDVDERHLSLHHWGKT